MIRRVAIPIHFATCLAVSMVAAPGSAQEAATKYAEWRLLEAADETADYRAKLRDGGFDAAAQAFLAQEALPQLALKRNRPTIDRVRRRMREVLCGDGGSNQAAAEAARKSIADFMTALVRNANAEPVVRVNAMLLVGELTTAQGKPWPGAVAPLAAALGDDTLPGGVRVAAAAGLARHVAEAGDALAPTVGPVLAKTASAPIKGVDAVGNDWLQSRALVMLADLGPAAPPDSAKIAAAILADESRSLDVRVRAAAVLGRCAKAGQVDGGKVVEAIRGLAVAAVEADTSRERRERLVRQFSGVAGAGAGAGLSGRPEAAWLPGGGMAEASSTTSPSQAYRRTAWRLATLADALLSADGTNGLAMLAGNDAPAARELAAALRKAAQDLDAVPAEASLGAALPALGLEEAEPATDDAAAPAGEAPAEPAVPGATPFSTPFGG